jgi:hypothetical protein
MGTVVAPFPIGVHTVETALDDAWTSLLAKAKLSTYAERFYVPEGLEDPNTLPIAVVVEEIRRWAVLSREDAWRYRKNRTSLATELSSATSGCGSRLLSRIASLVSEIDVALRQSSNGRTEVRIACEVAMSELQRDINVECALLDLVEAAQRGLDAADIDRRRAVLISILKERGIDGKRRLSTASGVLNGNSLETEVALIDLGETKPEHLSRNVSHHLNDEERVEVVRRFILAAPSVHRCVAWLQFQLALVRTRQIDAQSITFFRAADTIHAALEPNQTYEPPFADEIRKVFGRSANPVDYTRLHDQSVALVRVDLGSRPRHGALLDALRAVSTLVELAVAQNHGVQWSPFGTQTLLVDGRASEFRSGTLSRVQQHNHDYENFHGMNQTADGLEEWGKKVSTQLVSDRNSEYLSEAIALQAQAARLRNSDEFYDLGKGSIERSIITLDDRVVELVGSFGRISPNELVDFAFDGWAMATWHSEITFCIRTALRWGARSDLPRDREIYSSIFPRYGEQQKISYLKASEHENYLLEVDAPDSLRGFLASRLMSLRSAEKFMDLYNSYVEQGQFVKSRLRRVRNSVVHGNPASERAIEVACEASRYVSDSAISRALQQLTDGTSVSASYEEQAADRESMLDRLRAGTSWAEIWMTDASSA